MTTITTKQLRENMAQVVRDLKQGHSLELSYRHKIIAELKPIGSSPAPAHRGSAQAIKNFLITADFGPIPTELQSSQASFKEEVATLRQQKLKA